ncbi:MAG: di-trans,poly-cis-decaprenylcistransferase [Candidatus Nealsonbacteria bacterium RBG_13_37_56]|uniref:Isoprenyl transferase n=1 Tax=Candidatus Nealsonbacteria bacterium RBG_13_37_56 TaxID=1801661 RepID=A0A1G2DXB4_9BACT|nr:MAG: di-trans,poly-cis-decaprenylcistransferase [Candidatus Nealsonbacteria bacterium RBG_13_37_56]
MPITKIPNHLGIIIDGNRRWAKEKGLSSFHGHKKGLDNVEKIMDYCVKKGVKILTLYVFSVENWNRSKKEINYLMRLFVNNLTKKNIKKFNDKGIRFQTIGQKEKLPKLLQEKIKEIEKATKNNKKSILNLAISYGGRPEIIQAIKNIIKKKIPINKINEEIINQNLWTVGLAYPDFIIRTGGEIRLSNFLTWQSAYSELYFTKKYWPEFTEKDLDKALEEYNKRERRFGC